MLYISVLRRLPSICGIIAFMSFSSGLSVLPQCIVCKSLTTFSMHKPCCVGCDNFIPGVGQNARGYQVGYYRVTQSHLHVCISCSVQPSPRHIGKT
ncbi:hypothetical protein QL093DRAFT_2197750 [Fusarium oxysporum]|nr:hypothetical protein QL093DRAFT_2197750 [Fusarium oxysporum]